MSMSSGAATVAANFGAEGKAALSSLTDGLPLTVPQLTSTFSEQEIKQLLAARKAVDEATDKNEARAQAWKTFGDVLGKFSSAFGFGLF